MRPTRRPIATRPRRTRRPRMKTHPTRRVLYDDVYRDIPNVRTHAHTIESNRIESNHHGTRQRWYRPTWTRTNHRMTSQSIIIRAIAHDETTSTHVRLDASPRPDHMALVTRSIRRIHTVQHHHANTHQSMRIAHRARPFEIAPVATPTTSPRRRARRRTPSTRDRDARRADARRRETCASVVRFARALALERGRALECDASRVHRARLLRLRARLARVRAQPRRARRERCASDGVGALLALLRHAPCAHESLDDDGRRDRGWTGRGMARTGTIRVGAAHQANVEATRAGRRDVRAREDERKGKAVGGSRRVAEGERGRARRRRRGRARDRRGARVRTARRRRTANAR